MNTESSVSSPKILGKAEVGSFNWLNITAISSWSFLISGNALGALFFLREECEDAVDALSEGIFFSEDIQSKKEWTQILFSTS